MITVMQFAVLNSIQRQHKNFATRSHRIARFSYRPCLRSANLLAEKPVLLGNKFLQRSQNTYYARPLTHADQQKGRRKRRVGVGIHVFAESQYHGLGN